MIKVICLLFDGVEEIEAIAPVDLLRRAEIEVTLCTLDSGHEVTGRSGIVLQAETTVDETADALFLPGGPGITHLRKDERVAALVRRFFDAGKTIAAICAAPQILADAGILEGRKFTAHFSANLPAALNERVVQDGNLITSQGAGTAIDFGLVLIKHFCGTQKADNIAKAIMAK